jgi:hypothetical protein
VTDVAAPREHGIEMLAFTRLRSNRRIGGPVGPAALPFSRAARSWTIRHQQSQENGGLKPTDFMVGFGASWGAVVVGSYIRWLEERVRRCGIEHLLFMARDAWLLQQAWQAAGCEIRTGVGGTYLYASRQTLEAGNDLTENPCPGSALASDGRPCVSFLAVQGSSAAPISSPRQ